MKRRMSTRRRLQIFTDHDGICYLCGGKIDGVKEAYDIEHIIPLEISRDDSDENLAPAHKHCHKAKTKDDARDIAKCKRVAAKHTGAFETRNKLPGGRGSRLKKKVCGGVVDREEDEILGKWF